MLRAKLRVGLYARVSTTKASQDESPQGQLDDLRSYFARRDDCEIVMEKSDRVSGGRGEGDRPGLAAVLDAARARRIDLIGVTRIDRLFRSLPRWVDTSRELAAIGVGIVYSDHPELDPTTPTGKLLVYVLAALAEFFRDIYGAKAVEGKARALAAGKHCARPREVVPDHALRIVHGWIRSEVKPLSWREMSARLARSKICQPGRVIKTTGVARDARPWPPGTLWRAYAAWVEAGGPARPVQKTPRDPVGEIGELAGSKSHSAE